MKGEWTAGWTVRQLPCQDRTRVRRSVAKHANHHTKEFNKIVRNIYLTIALKDLRRSASERKIRMSVYIIFGLTGKSYLKI